jgi:hypothetical protein
MFIVLIYIYFISTLQQNHIILLSFIIFILNLYVYSYNIILPSLMTQYSFNIILPSLMTQQSLRPGVDRKTMFYRTANVQGNHIYYNNN